MSTPGTDKPKSTAAPAKKPAAPTGPGAVQYLDLVGKRTLITISVLSSGSYANQAGAGLKVQGIISPEYSFSIKNDFEPLLKSAGVIAEFTKGSQAFNQLVYGTGLSVVPYSPQIWMGADPLRIAELSLHFVCYKSAELDVHKPLMDLLAMALPQGNGREQMGMLLAPPAVEIKIGEVIKWSPCFIESCVVTEKAPYTEKGFGMTGEAKVTIIRRDFIFAEDFKQNPLSPTVVVGKPPAPK